MGRAQLDLQWNRAAAAAAAAAVEERIARRRHLDVNWQAGGVLGPGRSSLACMMAGPLVKHSIRRGQGRSSCPGSGGGSSCSGLTGEGGCQVSPFS